MADGNLKVQLQQDMKASLKAKDSARLGVIRMIMNEIKQAEIDQQTAADDTQTLQILQKMLKQRQDAHTQYIDAGREDLADQEAFEMNVVKTYLPEPLTEQELLAMIENSIATLDAPSMRDMGSIVQNVKAQCAGRADMAWVSQQIKQRLSS